MAALRNSHPSLTMAALLCATVALSGCAGGRHVFQQGNMSGSQYQRDARSCEQQADGSVATNENYAERYENGSDTEIIGAGLGAMLATADRGAGRYNRCMRNKGYKE